MSRRKLIFLPVVAAALVVFFLTGRGGAEVPTHLHLGAMGATTRQIELRYRTTVGDSVVAEATLRFPSGAPADLYRRQKLRKGDYEVGIRVLDATGRERQVTRAVHVTDGEHPIEIDIAEGAP